MKVKIRYFASLRERAGMGQEELEIDSSISLRKIYSMLSSKYGFSLGPEQIKYSVNNEYVNEDVRLRENDVVVFIPPVAGG